MVENVCLQKIRLLQVSELSHNVKPQVISGERHLCFDLAPVLDLPKDSSGGEVISLSVMNFYFARNHHSIARSQRIVDIFTWKEAVKLLLLWAIGIAGMIWIAMDGQHT